jgi:uncharacterized protein (DUF1499 family)
MSLRSILFSLPLLVASLFSLISCTTSPPPGGLIEGHLRPCPNRPNCVNSDSGDSDSIAPISFHTSPEEAWQQMQIIIQKLGGKISKQSSMYLSATFTSSIFHFVDDVELRMEPQNNLIHIRSAARIGYFDFGVNRKRVEKIRKLFTEEQSKVP